jgi:hypothetical protein
MAPRSFEGKTANWNGLPVCDLGHERRVNSARWLQIWHIYSSESARGSRKYNRNTGVLASYTSLASHMKEGDRRPVPISPEATTHPGKSANP